MNRSISSLVLGLIFSIIGGISGYILWTVFILISIGNEGILQLIFSIGPLINLATFGLSFIGSFFCIGKAKAGGIIMFIASLISLICLLTILMAIKTFPIIYVLFFIPTLVIFHAAIAAMKKKKRT